MLADIPTQDTCSTVRIAQRDRAVLITFVEFFDPLSNKRTDQYGGSFENRTRIAVETTEAIRKVWDKPLFFRVSASDWLDEPLGPEKKANGDWAWW